MLTGLYVFYEECDEAVAQQRVIDGEWPYIDERWSNNSFAEARLVDIMQQCWTYNADDRIDIGALVLLLREAVEENRKRQDTLDEDRDSQAGETETRKHKRKGTHHHYSDERYRDHHLAP